MNIHYATPPRQIGKHLWRCLVIENADFPDICFQWKPLQGLRWHPQQDWPAYDKYKPYVGLPNSVRKLQSDYWQTIRAYLAGELPAQVEMFPTLEEPQPEQIALV